MEGAAAVQHNNIVGDGKQAETFSFLRQHSGVGEFSLPSHRRSNCTH